MCVVSFLSDNGKDAIVNCNYHIAYYSTYLLLSEHGFGDACQTAHSAVFKFKSNE